MVPDTGSEPVLNLPNRPDFWYWFLHQMWCIKKSLITCDFCVAFFFHFIVVY
ncbi:hypothetical protein HanPSC8_Chr02g0074451 [Helianthus annuus]|nr:hypothetical protein HanPSC8_Chr02g0074451 [Helianthus annuus]